MTSNIETVGGFPVARYKHPERIGDIALIGMKHAQQTREPYDVLNAYLKERHTNGGEVHTEGIRRATHAEMGRVDKKVRRRVQLFDQELGYHSDVYRFLGLKLQKYCLEGFPLDDEGRPHHDSSAINGSIPWRPHDFSSLDFAMQLPGVYLGANLQDATNSYWWVRNLTPVQQELLAQSFFMDDEQRYLVMDELPSGPYSEANERIKSKYRALEVDVSVRQRDKLAVGAVRASALADPNMPITITWGESHMPGIGKGLEALGYELQAAPRT